MNIIIWEFIFVLVIIWICIIIGRCSGCCIHHLMHLDLYFCLWMSVVILGFMNFCIFLGLTVVQVAGALAKALA